MAVLRTRCFPHVRYRGSMLASVYFQTIYGLVNKGSKRPSLQFQQYASPLSKIEHINCKDASDMKQLLQTYFDHVFIFSMNNEVVHTGYHPMAQHLFALYTGVRRD